MKPLSIRYIYGAFIGLVALCAAGALQAEPVFIANSDAGQTALTAEEVESILTGKLTKWKAGSNITLILQTEGATHDEVCRTHGKRTADQLEKHWKKLVFTGKGRAPVTAKSDAEVMELVAKTPGALGYVERANVGAGVIVLKLN